jgi:hypothetical protein
MDVVKAVETYVSKMISTPNAMKVLLLDSHTVRWSTVLTLSNADIELDPDSITCGDTKRTFVSASVSYG